MTRYTITAHIDTAHPLTDAERDAILWNVQLAATEPCDEDGDVLDGYGATLVNLTVTEATADSGRATLASTVALFGIGATLFTFIGSWIFQATAMLGGAS